MNNKHNISGIWSFCQMSHELLLFLMHISYEVLHIGSLEKLYACFLPLVWTSRSEEWKKYPYNHKKCCDVFCCFHLSYPHFPSLKIGWNNNPIDKKYKRLTITSPFDISASLWGPSRYYNPLVLQYKPPFVALFGWPPGPNTLPLKKVTSFLNGPCLSFNGGTQFAVVGEKLQKPRKSILKQLLRSDV